MNLSERSDLLKLLQRHGVSPTKSLGQHFLCSSSVVEAIAAKVALMKGVLEIGPGPGALTSVIALTSEKYVAIELDETMLPILAETSPKAEIIRQDVLTTDLRGLLRGLPQPRAVVSNMPYSITGLLLNRVAEVRDTVDLAVLMMQKEVAERVTARPGNSDRGSLSVFLQSIFDITLVALAPAEAFYPPPKVDSAVLEFVPNRVERSGRFFEIVRAGFVQPRKTLSNNLVSALKLPRSTVDGAIASLDQHPMVRGHTLTMEHWERLESLLSR